MSQGFPENEVTPPPGPSGPAGGGDRLRLSDVRAMFRLVNELRELGSDPQKWRPHMVQRLRKLLRAGIVVSSEVHFRRTPKPGTMKVIDIGWFSDTDGQTSQIHTERDDESPEAFWLSAGGGNGARPVGPNGREGELVPVTPSPKIYGGTSFILSQVSLPHAAAVDQLGLHREFGEELFTRAEHKLIRMFHVELGRLWRRDVLHRAKERGGDLPPRLAQTLDQLLAGSSEKQIANKLDLSRHTIHNYVKALHQRFEVNSRGELLAKAGQIRQEMGLQLTLSLPPLPPSRGRRKKAARNSAGGSGV